MKPCVRCVEIFNKPCCNVLGHCVLEDVPGMSPEDVLYETVTCARNKILTVTDFKVETI
jgi:hypothetical protein